LISAGLAAPWAHAQTILTLNGNLNQPNAVALDSAGDAFVTTGDDNVDEFLAAGGFTSMTDVGGGLGLPVAVVIDSPAKGNAFVVDSVHNTVRMYVGLALGPAASVPEVTITGNFNHPMGIAVDASDDIFVADTGNGVVKELVAPAYTTVKTIGSGFKAPAGLAIDGSGNLFVADTGFGNVFEVTAASNLSNVLALGSGFNAPSGVAVDKLGDVFVADTGNAAVKEIMAGGAVSTVAGGFMTPQGIGVDPSGNVFVADPGANSVFEVPVGTSKPVAIGRGAGAFKAPMGIGLDTAGDVFIADGGDDSIKLLLASLESEMVVDTVVTGLPIAKPRGVAVDAGGNVFVGDVGQTPPVVKQLLAQSRFTALHVLDINVQAIGGVALDSAGNLFVTDGSALFESSFASGYSAMKQLATGFNQAQGLAVDAKDDVFVADTGNNAVKEVTAGSNAVKAIGSGFKAPQGIALDAAGDVFVADTGDDAIKELLAAGGFTSIDLIGSGFNAPQGVAVDAKGNVFVADTGNSALKEVLSTAPTLFASVLPGSRSVQIGKPATIFASIINAGTAALSNCTISLPDSAPQGLSLTFQTTNPATNQPTGQPNTPVTIAGNDGIQSFVLSFAATSAFSAPGLPLDFGCSAGDRLTAAQAVTGVDTFDLVFSTTPIADIIALSATPTNNGVIEVPLNGIAAFAVASTNIGITDTITVSVDTGSANLPVVTTICQTGAGAQCLAPAAPSVTLSYGANTAPTFSIFLQSTGAIAFAPASSRIFVRFKDASGGLHGSTSVAIETL
jgi:sugar lactone lactonase YvrE